MVRIINCCYSNLNYKSDNETLGEDITTQITVTSSPILILPANSNRRILKIYVLNLSNQLAELWLRHGTNISVLNSTFQVPLKYLFTNTTQAAQALSGICTTGAATIRVTTVNKL